MSSLACIGTSQLLHTSLVRGGNARFPSPWQVAFSIYLIFFIIHLYIFILACNYIKSCRFRSKSQSDLKAEPTEMYFLWSLNPAECLSSFVIFYIHSDFKMASFGIFVPVVGRESLMRFLFVYLFVFYYEYKNSLFVFNLFFFSIFFSLSLFFS